MPLSGERLELNAILTTQASVDVARTGRDDFVSRLIEEEMAILIRSMQSAASEEEEERQGAPRGEIDAGTAQITAAVQLARRDRAHRRRGGAHF